MIPWQSIKRTYWNDIQVIKFSPSDCTEDGHAGIESHKKFAKVVARQISKQQMPPKVIQK